MSIMLKTTITADGNSDSVSIVATSTQGGECVVCITATTWGASTSVTLEGSTDGTNWFSVEDSTATENAGFIGASEIFYRMVVVNYSGSDGLSLEVLPLQELNSALGS